MGKVRLLNKGKVTIPKAIRTAHQWLAGTEFTVTGTAAGVLLTPIEPFKSTTAEDVFGCLPYRGKTKSLRAMKQGIVKALKKKK